MRYIFRRSCLKIFFFFFLPGKAELFGGAAGRRELPTEISPTGKVVGARNTASSPKLWTDLQCSGGAD